MAGLVRGLVLAAQAALLCGALPAAAAGARAIERRAIEEQTADYRIEAAYPVTGLAAVDDELRGWVEGEAAQFRKQAVPPDDATPRPWTLDIGYTVERNDASVLALSFAESTYTGGAHGNHVLRTYDYLMPDGRRVDLAEVLAGENGLRRLSALAIADLDRRLGGPDSLTDAGWIRRGAGPDWANFGNFLLLPDALKILFPPYQVAAYAAGPQEVRIPLSALRGVLRADWRAPAASFDCAKAATPVERAVCSDAALARLDREVAAAYRARLSASGGPAARRAVRAAQRDWSARRAAACPSPDGAVACLTAAYRARLAELAPTP